MIYVSNTYEPEITVVHFQLQHHSKKLFYFITFRQINKINRKFNMSFFLDTTFSFFFFLGNCYIVCVSIFILTQEKLYL